MQSKIFSENYLLLFKKYYYKNAKVINLREYGENKIIFLSNEVKTFNNVLKKD